VPANQVLFSKSKQAGELNLKLNCSAFNVLKDKNSLEVGILLKSPDDVGVVIATEFRQNSPVVMANPYRFVPPLTRLKLDKLFGR
jgi:hypothetical protein